MNGIYLIINLIDGKKYVGKSECKDILIRLEEHKRNYHSNAHLQNAINKYGIENFEFLILEECSKEDCWHRERYWINYYKTNNPKFGYNKTSGGENHSGWKMSDTSNMKKSKSDSHKRNISLSKIGNNNSKEYYSNLENRKKHSEVLSRKYQDKQWKDNHDKAVALALSKDSVKQKMSDSQHKRWNENERFRQAKNMKGNQFGKGRVHINNGFSRRMVTKDELNDYLSKGWKLGRGKLKNYNPTTIESIG